MGKEELESPTPSTSMRCSSQLSYLPETSVDVTNTIKNRGKEQSAVKFFADALEVADVVD